MFGKLALLATLAVSAFAAPAISENETLLALVARKASLEARALDTSSHCGQWDQITVSGTNYILNLDQWGISGKTGSNCAQLTSASGTTVAWKTTWTWSGDGIKTYPNIQLTKGINKQLSAIKSIQVRLYHSISAFARF
jgi:xyloglucan-specific endo-beta-1,4-glucanase